MSTTLRRGWLRALRWIGVRHFKAMSGSGHPFICHLGDFAGELPFYNLKGDLNELTAMAAWCSGRTRPVIFDVGANLGFVATQLVQMLKDQQPIVVAFEPVWSTFAKLKHSVRALSLDSNIWPVCCGISDRAEVASIAFDEVQSLFAQVRLDTANARAGRKLEWVSLQTIDSALAALALTPTLLKVDVEGFEAHVFRGAERLLSGPNAPAILFELNPIALREVGSSVGAVAEALPQYKFYYIGDFEGQLMPFGAPVETLDKIDHVCNLFAVSTRTGAAERWKVCFNVLAKSPTAQVKSRL